MAETDCGKSCDECIQKEVMAMRAATLGKWLWVLFWLIVPNTIAGIMSSNFILNVSPSIYEIGNILSIVCGITYGFILLKLSKEQDRYRTAGICTMMSAMVGVVDLIIAGAERSSIWLLIIVLPITIVSLVGEYNEYIAHSLVLWNVDDELSRKWAILWKWYIRCVITMGCSIIIMFILPVLAYIVLLGATIGSVVVGIIKLVYLYRMAKVFRKY